MPPRVSGGGTQNRNQMGMTPTEHAAHGTGEISFEMGHSVWQTASLGAGKDPSPILGGGTGHDLETRGSKTPKHT